MFTEGELKLTLDPKAAARVPLDARATAGATLASPASDADAE
ncbi:MAG TPA: hypothetical protein VMQ50_18930 [Casimicrobiaceae bacterium]|nr:hypothetical protein [Casimicrobiaceae bacterium]